MNTPEPIVTYADLDDLRGIRDAATTYDRRYIDDPDKPAGALALLDRLIAAAEADQPPLPVKVPLLYSGPCGDERVLYAQEDGRLTIWRDGASRVNDTVEQLRDSLTPLRPSVTEADVEKAARAAHAAYFGSDRWDAALQDTRDAWMKTARAAFEAAGIEAQS